MAKGNSAEEIQAKSDFQKRKRQEAVKNAIWCSSLPPINVDDPEQVKERIALYFEHCAEAGFIIGQEGLCNALKITTSTFRTWLNGSARKGQEHQKICMQAEQVIKAYMEDGILSGDIPPVPSIFIMSNLHGYAQKTEVKVDAPNTFIDTATPEQLEKRYSKNGTIIDAVFEEKKQKAIPQKTSTSTINKSIKAQTELNKETVKEF